MTRAGRLALRPGPLRAAAGLAAIFVVARVVYRVLFDGASGTGAVLLPLPRIPLPPPFGWVSLLGPVTVDGLRDAVLSALPVAGVILAFGILNALFDVSRLFAKLARRGPLRGIARAMAIAWSTLPALGAAVRRVRVAQRLRGGKPGPRMLVPVLERTLERAAAIANGLELRGFGGRPVDGDCEHPVAVSHAVLGFGDRDVLTTTRFTLRYGSLAVVTGPTGSGKSTLLRALAGLHDHVDGGWSTGAVTVAGRHRRDTPPRDTSRLVGVVLQNPREGFCSERVRDEIGLAMQLRGVAPVIVAARVDEVARHLGITELLDRTMQTLSAGEATMVAIAAAVVERPVLLLVDEPLADLDADARIRVAGALDALAHDAGVCVVVAEHRWAGFGDAADSWWRIDTDARTLVVSARPSGAEPDSAGEIAPDDAIAAHAARDGAPTPRLPVLAASALRIAHGDTVAVHDATFSLAAGEIAALIGPNGAGKSSLLLALALPPKGVGVTGHPVLVPDSSDDLFTRDTVTAECARADRVARRSGAADLVPAADRFAAFLGLDDDALAARMRRHPLDLSLGERRCLAIALQLTRSPDALLIDEPTRGLDASAREQVRVALQQAADAGTAVLLATHDADFAAALGARVLPMRDGVVPAAALPVAVAEHTASALRVAPHTASAPSVVERAAGETTRASRSSAEAHRVSSFRLASLAQHGARFGRSTAGTTLVIANLVALAAFTWPFVASALPGQAESAAPWAALALVPVAALVVLAALDESVRSAHTLAYLSVLAAIGTAVRIASTGVGGVEAVFILLILAGRAFGARFGMLLGAATIALSSTVFGGFGPWTPFQMFACAWVGAGAGLLPRRLDGRAEIAMLCVYGVVASYVFGLLMNVWFWPFAVGAGTAISYVPGAPLGQNLGSFLLYSLVTSTAGWDTLRAVTTIVGVILIGRPVLAALRRAKPLVATPEAMTRAPHLPVHAPSR
ncbi:ATP-binding cassette domain-containing protein [Microbacterium sp. SD291]|uniref:ATP-binding cassette domain-containing protein n=1 Tax=Microbacterium sp. SD291 TaxID=2782007 RepID=UPI001A976E2E|nr:ATP-binding cassette domain-containing protein [Microbacterium sp. SD291]MBO0981992.1 ATP-binding cassette domain-containing protein [Microbacterium sp. SD291]